MKTLSFLALFSLSTLTSAYELKRTQPEARDAYYYSLGPNARFIISKERFKSHPEALKFCSSHLLGIASETELVTVGMAGEDRNEAIKEALYFEMELENHHMSGIMGWANKSSDAGDLVLLENAKGFDIEKAHYQEVKEKLNATGIPAVCAQIPPLAQELMVDDSSRDSE